GGYKFPRTFAGMEGGVESTTFSARGQSLVRENTKFMDVWRLKDLLDDQSGSSRVRKVLDTFITNEQLDTFLGMIASQLAGEDGQARLVQGEIEFFIQRGRALTVQQERKLVIGSPSPDIVRPVRMVEARNGQAVKTFEGQLVEITATPD